MGLLGQMFAGGVAGFADSVATNIGKDIEMQRQDELAKAKQMREEAYALAKEKRARDEKLADDTRNHGRALSQYFDSDTGRQMTNDEAEEYDKSTLYSEHQAEEMFKIDPDKTIDRRPATKQQLMDNAEANESVGLIRSKMEKEGRTTPTQDEQEALDSWKSDAGLIETAKQREIKSEGNRSKQIGEAMKGIDFTWDKKDPQGSLLDLQSKMRETGAFTEKEVSDKSVEIANLHTPKEQKIDFKNIIVGNKEQTVMVKGDEVIPVGKAGPRWKESSGDSSSGKEEKKFDTFAKTFWSGYDVKDDKNVVTPKEKQSFVETQYMLDQGRKRGVQMVEVWDTQSQRYTVMPATTFSEVQALLKKEGRVQGISRSSNGVISINGSNVMNRINQLSGGKFPISTIAPNMLTSKPYANVFDRENAKKDVGMQDN